MIIRDSRLNIYEEWSRIAGLIDPDSRLLFFDIETTGLSPLNSYLYLIGCMWCESGSVYLRQYFSEGPQDEPELLRAFTDLADEFDTLVHFNGQTFDIPYIEKKLLSHGMDRIVLPSGSFDIYKKLRPYKEILGCSSMNQKTLERYVGLFREDRFDGGELIGVYNRYLAMARIEKLRNIGRPSETSSGSDRPGSGIYMSDGTSGLPSIGSSPSEALLETLLLHNYEDVKGMLKVALLLELPCFLNGSFTVDDICPDCDSVVFSLKSGSETVQRLASRSCELTIDKNVPPIVLDCCDSPCLVHIRMPLFCGELKHFYPNTQDYYYLPAEDSAVHKSIAQFMDPSLRKKATTSNCYTRHSGTFFPVGSDKDLIPEGLTVFKESSRSKLNYISTDELYKLPSDKIHTLLSSVLGIAR